MKKILKGVVVPVVIAILIGFIIGKYIFRTYKDNLYTELSSSRLYLIENGEYDNIDDMRINNNDSKYVYYKDNDKYKKVVGITKEYDNVDKIKKLYDDEVTVSIYYIDNTLVNDKQGEYDKELMNSNNMDDVRDVVNNILELYRENNNIKLING